MSMNVRKRTVSGQISNHSHSSSESTGEGNNWSYLITIKWILLGLTLSLGSVYLIDLISTSLFSSNSNKSDPPSNLPQLSEELQNWLVENQLDQHSTLFQQIGVVTLVSVVQLDYLTKEVGLKHWIKIVVLSASLSLDD